MGSLRKSARRAIAGLVDLLEQSELFLWQGVAAPEVAGSAIMPASRSVFTLRHVAMATADRSPAPHRGVITDLVRGESVVSEREKEKQEHREHSLSVVLPAYNEEAIIEKTVTKVALALSQWTQDFEIIVVNDGSKDRTHEIVERLARREPRIHLIDHPINKGYGAALVTGFQSVDKDLVFFMDSDGQFDINDLEPFFPLIEKYDAVFGYRNPRRDPWLRKLNAWGWKQLVHLVFAVQVRDIDCAFKLYRAEFFQTLNLETRGAMINAEILYKFKRAGRSYAEVGVRHLPREEGVATGANPAVILRAIRELFIYARKWRQEERRRSR